MAKRSYPRFLFSDPQNVKSPGPFIIHTIEPRMIFKIIVGNNAYNVEMIDDWSIHAGKNIEKLRSEALDWLLSQIISNEIILPYK